VKSLEGLELQEALETALVGLLNGNIKREAAASWATRTVSWRPLLHSPMGNLPGDAHLALLMVNTDETGWGEGTSGNWFLTTTHLSSYLEALRGQLSATPLEGGWHNAPFQVGLPDGFRRLGWCWLRDRAGLARRLGAPTRGRDDFAPFEAWDLLAPTKHHYSVFRYMPPPDYPDTIELLCWDAAGDPASEAREAAFWPLAELLALDLDAIGVLEDGPPTPTRWALWRRDDNNNEFRISRHLTQSAAQARADHFESLGHKQDYWVQPIE